jgi:TM2 domain-containing membrane protein YozV
MKMSFGQVFPKLQKDSLFLHHLLDRNENHDALQLISQLRKQYPDSVRQYLDLNYWQGFVHYSLKQLDSSAFYLSSISRANIHFEKAQFLGGISSTYLKRWAISRETFHKITPSDSLTMTLKNFELSGIALLQRNFIQFDSLQKIPVLQHFALAKQQDNFRDYKDIIQKQQRKSPLKAALMSAIIPGSGKIYAGQLGQGIAAFLQNAIFGLQAYEGLQKDGIKSPRFIIYGGLFTLFYIGNVWGSALSVQIKRREFNEKVDEQIIFDMHIPLRTIFN